MNADRMRDLAEVWGGDLRRWPETERWAAEAFSREAPETAERALFAARQLDAALDAAPRPVVSAELRDRVIASATTAGLRARTVWPGLRKLLWVGGAGWAAAACAGVVFGQVLTSDFERQVQLDVVLEQASVGGLDDTAFLG
jgi:1,6-anhydro-N-acetylmuramate kinase